MGLFSKAKQGMASMAADGAKKLLAEEDARLSEEIAEKKRLLAELDDSIDMIEYGIHAPKFDFQSVDEYKVRLAECREKQKEQLRKLTAKANETTWTVNNSKTQGKKMVRDITKLIMRAYNGECDELVRKVSARNVDASLDKAWKSAESISKLGSVIGLDIPNSYIELKKQEILLAYEYAVRKEEEKERIRELKAQEREAAKAAKELEAERKKLEKERHHHEQALSDIDKRLLGAEGDERAELLKKKEELLAVIEDVDHAIEDVDYRTANQRAGYVYVISNIGSFGEGVYKIGMTRRLEPMDRVRELGDASVPFNFDVHALIFTEDAPGLEAALHREFDDRRVNKINNRREFFRVTLDEIKDCVHENFDGTAEFFDVPDAVQYRETLAMEGFQK